MVEGCLVDKKWRFKLAIAENIVNLFRTLSFEEHREFLEKIITVFLKDHNYIVREQTIKSIVQVRDSIGSERYFELVQKYMGILSGDVNYIYRTTACIFLQHVRNLEKNQFNEIFSTLSKH